MVIEGAVPRARHKIINDLDICQASIGYFRIGIFFAYFQLSYLYQNFGLRFLNIELVKWPSSRVSITALKRAARIKNNRLTIDSL